MKDMSNIGYRYGRITLKVSRDIDIEEIKEENISHITLEDFEFTSENIKKLNELVFNNFSVDIILHRTITREERETIDNICDSYITATALKKIPFRPHNIFNDDRGYINIIVYYNFDDYNNYVLLEDNDCIILTENQCSLATVSSLTENQNIKASIYMMCDKIDEEKINLLKSVNSDKLKLLPVLSY